MKVRIVINEHYAQRLLIDNEFRNNLTLVINHQLFIEEIWIENTVIDNDEITFRNQTLTLVGQHFCRIFNEQPNTLDIAVDGIVPVQLCILGRNNPLRNIVTITDFQID